MEKGPSKRALQIRSVISVLVIVVLWEVAARAGLASPLFLPAFTAVMAEWWTVCADGSLPSDLLTSLFRAFAGLIAATLVGVLLGIAMARSRLVHWMFDPVIALAFPSPKIGHSCRSSFSGSGSTARRRSCWSPLPACFRS